MYQTSHTDTYYIAIHYITIIESIKHKEQEEWQIRWNNTSKTKAYLHRFHIIDNPTCTCKTQPTVNHLIYEYPDIGQQRLKLINQITQNRDKLPVTNQQLIFRHLRNFCEFVKSMNL